jgi:hypothetical protein
VGYIVAWDAHWDALCRHSTRLARERPRPAGPPSSAALRQAFEEARAAATAAGFPPAWKAVRPPEPEPPPPDPIEVARRKSLPRAVRRDIEDTRTAEEHVYERIRAEQRAAGEVEDGLAPYRDRSPPGMPPYWPDS